MGQIKLKKLIATGSNKNTSEIVFGKKLTIIAGPSDTGKSCIYKCIDYILGAKNDDDHAPFDESDGYDTIQLILSSSFGDISLKRKQGTNITEVFCENQEIESGEYVLNECKSNTKTINKLMLKLLGLKENLQIPKNADGDPVAFTWRTLKKTFLIDEDRADKPKSILLQQNGETTYLASLIYFLTGDTLESYIRKDESEEIKKAKRNAVIAYISSHKNEMTKKKELMEAKLKEKGIDNESLESIIEQLNNQILKINDEINALTSESASISANLLSLQRKNQKNEIVYSKYGELKEQYQKEINRLTFIVNNEVSLSNQTTRKCPFCDHKMEAKNTQSYIETARVELQNVINNLNELDETSSMLKDTLDDDNDQITIYEETLEKNKKMISDVLVPKRTELAKILNGYEEYVKIKSAIDELEQSAASLESDLAKYKKGDETPSLKFEAKKILYSIIGDFIKENSIQMFTDVEYSNIKSIDFTESKLDLIVNTKKKIRRGKGYKAFTNSMLILLLRKYIEENAKNKCGFYFLDSPLKGLSVPENQDDDSENIRKGFFKYLIDLKTNDQLIIIENTKYKELPQLELNDDVLIYKFTQKENDGRYGFLIDVRKA